MKSIMKKKLILFPILLSCILYEGSCTRNSINQQDNDIRIIGEYLEALEKNDTKVINKLGSYDKLLLQELVATLNFKPILKKKMMIFAKDFSIYTYRLELKNKKLFGKNGSLDLNQIPLLVLKKNSKVITGIGVINFYVSDVSILKQEKKKEVFLKVGNNIKNYFRDLGVKEKIDIDINKSAKLYVKYLINFYANLNDDKTVYFLKEVEVYL